MSNLVGNQRGLRKREVLETTAHVESSMSSGQQSLVSHFWGHLDFGLGPSNRWPAPKHGITTTCQKTTTTCPKIV